MAVVDNNTFDARTKAMKVGGTDAIFVRSVATITSGDTNGSVYRVAKIPGNYVPFSLELFSSANITNVNSADVGFYYDAEFSSGAVIDVDALAAGLDLTTAKPRSAAGLFGLKSLSVADSGKTVAELLGLGASEYQTFDLALTINVTAGASGVVWFDGVFINRA